MEDNEVVREVTAYANSKDQFYHAMVGSYSSLNVTLNFNLADDEDCISLEKLKESLCKLIDIYDSVTEKIKNHYSKS